MSQNMSCTVFGRLCLKPVSLIAEVTYCDMYPITADSFVCTASLGLMCWALYQLCYLATAMHVTVGCQRWCVSHDTLPSSSWQITDGYIVCSRANIEANRSAVMSSGATYCLNQQEVRAKINTKALRVAIHSYEAWQVYRHTVTYQAADPALGDVSAGYWRSTKLRHCTNTEQL